MKANVGGVDKVLRIMLGVALIAWAAMGGPVWAWIGVVPLRLSLLLLPPFLCCCSRHAWRLALQPVPIFLSRKPRRRGQATPRIMGGTWTIFRVL